MIYRGFGLLVFCHERATFLENCPANPRLAGQDSVRSKCVRRFGYETTLSQSIVDVTFVTITQ